jgi:DNA-binding transcriptional regulator GbsR (MarR family)
MIEIVKGTLEYRIIKILQKIYPITLTEIQNSLHLSKNNVLRVLKKLQAKRIIQLEPLPGKTYIRLLRNDFSFVGRKRQRKFIKHEKNSNIKDTDEYDGMMYS